MSGYRGLHMKGKVMFAALTCCIGAMAVTVHGHSARKPEQIHLALGETLDQMTVVWSTWLPTKESIVEYGTAMEGMASNSSGSWQTLSNRMSVQYIHTVKLDDLAQGTKYFYRCGDGQTWSTVYTFTTVRNDTDWKPRFIIYGDLGYKEAVSVKELTKEAVQGSVDVILHNGDLAYDLHTDHGRVGDNFMNLIEPIAARVPYMVAVGNHEAFNWNYTNYKARFRMPGTPDNLWYSFKVGPVHFVIVSTEVYFFLLYGGMEAIQAHYTWLEDTLKEANKPENRKQWPWVITLGHRPMYCSNIALRYCRLDTNPVFNGSFQEPYRNPRGPVHITSGVAGNQEGTSSFRGIRQLWSAFGSTERGYTRVIPHNATHLYFEQVSAERGGEVIDKVWIIKDSHGSYAKLFPEDKKKVKSKRKSRLMKLLEPLKFLRRARSGRRRSSKLVSK